jgi:hypothetical protein
MTNDGGWVIPVAGEYPPPTDGKTLQIIHDTMFHVDEAVLIELIAAAYNDLNRTWLHFRKVMYAVHSEEIFNETQYKDAMNYILVACVHADQLDEMLDLATRIREMG